MKRINKNRKRLHADQNAVIHFYLLVVLLLFSAGGICADANTQDIAAQSSEMAAEKAVKEPTQRTVDEVAEKAAEKVMEKATEKATEKIAAEVVEKAAKLAREKSEQEAAAKQEIKARRPEEWKGPTKAYFRVFVLDIDAIDDANQNFTANVYIQLRWKDERLAYPDGSVREIHLEEVWNPQLAVANRVGLVSRSLPEVVQVDPDGTVTYRQRYSGMFSQPLRLANFPMDKHAFTIQFASAAYSTDELEFIPDTPKYEGMPTGGSIAEEISLQDWKLLRYEVLALPYQPIREIHAAGFAFRFEAERYVKYYFLQVLLPLSVVVVMSCAGFWLQREQVGVRIGVATSSILTLIAQRFVLASLLPRLPYLTRMDYFTVGSTLLVFLALIGVVSTSYLASTNRDLMAERIDLWARVVFPAAFLLLLGWFLVGLLN
jgi:hypothetical protein